MSHINFRLIAILILVPSLARAADTVTVDRTAAGGVDVKVNGKPFATYVIDQANKPYVWPVYGPTGKLMVRSYPIKDVEGEQKDHPHHRGINFGHEKVGPEGVDVWIDKGTIEDGLKKGTDAAKKKLETLGTQKHRDFTKVEAKNDTAVIGETIDYMDTHGKRLLTEERTLTFRAGEGVWMIDFDQDLIASDGAVKLADAKDAGLSIRVPTSMAVDTKKGGRIITSTGLTDEKAWGKPADWCDYNGPVEGETLGVAMLDHPTSFRHPTNWHVRTYGLFTANAFGAKVFDKDAVDASMEIKSGERIKLRHRFVFHSGDEKSANIAQAYEAYAKEGK